MMKIQQALAYPLLRATVMALGLMSLPLQPQATSICDCCNAEQSGSCKAACEELSAVSSLCRPAVDFTGTPPADNVLYGKSLQGIRIGKASGRDLEQFRRIIEQNRKSAEDVYSAAQRDYRRRKLSNADLLTAQAKRDAALVNYHHAMQAYIEALRR